MSWHASPEVQCDFSNALGVAMLYAILISDALLVFTPLRMLWRMKLPDEQRRLILAGFAAGVWTSIARGICFCFAFGSSNQGLSPEIIPPLLGHAMASIALMVCNSMVIATCAYRLVWSDKDLEHSISKAVSNDDMSPLTTVVLTNPGCSGNFSQDPYCHGPRSSARPR
ncbi:hypothetical protein BD779DRAFT_1682856 [Infundibulicybe gibba]|nr:hypothetical protein BD779DRAFT_1682856 [Infundibulicybe gibba]